MEQTGRLEAEPRGADPRRFHRSPGAGSDAAPRDTVMRLFDRYPGARSFEDNPIDSELFFGRRAETEEFIHKLLSNRLVVLFGKSGLGKTSLLQAGAFFRLREAHYLPLTQGRRLANARVGTGPIRGNLHPPNPTTTPRHRRRNRPTGERRHSGANPATTAGRRNLAFH